MRYTTIMMPAMIGMYVASIFQFGIVRDLPLFTVATILAAISILPLLLSGAAVLPRQRVLRVVVIAYGILIVISCYVSHWHTSLNPLLTYTFFVVAAMICILFGANLTSYDVARLGNWQALAFLTIAAYCLISQDIRPFRYRGAFDNSNSMGRFAFMQIAFCLAIWRVQNDPRTKSSKILLLAAFATAGILLLFSQSRTSMACSAIAALIYAVSYWRVYRSSFKRTLAKRPIFFLSLLGIGAWVTYGMGLWDQLIEKMEQTTLRGNFTQDRIEFWSVAVEHLSAVGYLDYFTVISIRSVHNNYLHMALNYGVPAAFLFFGVMWLVLLWSLWNGFRTRLDSAVATSILIVPCLIYFMAETGAAIG